MQFLWGNLRGKREVGKPGYRGEGNIKNRHLRNGTRRHRLE
jgi:hypothetical protein